MLKIIGGKHRQKTILAPLKETIIPTKNIVREALFSIINDRIINATFLDLFSGSGAIGLEALSRGAQHTTFVDKDLGAIKVIDKNITKLKEEENATLLHVDYHSAIKSFLLEKKAFDFIYLDPPYNFQFYLQLVSYIFDNNLLNSNGVLIVESEKEIDFLNIKKIKQKQYRYGRTFLFVLSKEKTA